MKKIFTIVSLSFLFCVSLFSQDFGTAVKDDADSLWRLTPDKFKSTFGSSEIYKWKTALKTVLTYDSKGSETELLFLKQSIAKANFSFKSKRLQGMSLTLAKSDALSSKKAYLEHISNLKEQITGLSKIGTPKVRKRKSKYGSSYTYSWKSPEYYISLKCSFSTDQKKIFKPGNIKFSIFRRVALAAPVKKIEASSETAANSNIKTDDKGGRYLLVPMIKENSPKECVAVCMKRIFTYYKTNPKDRSWKKISGNLTLNVKSAKGLKQVFSSITSECRCKVKKLASTSVFDNFNSVLRFARDYNAQAVKDKKNRINPFKANSFKKLLEVMDGDVLVNVRNNSKKIKDFKSRVCKEIDAEKPVLWIVFLGVVKEKVKPLAPLGGRARLIVGYNPKTNEVIYSDNWGKGHELKKMSWKKAWAITLTALSVTVKK
jgi:hypothetical protein